MWWHHGVWCCGGVEDEWCLFVLFCLFCCCGKVYVCLCECVCVSRGCLGWACTKPPPPAPTTSPPLFRILLNDIICVLCFVFVFCVLCFGADVVTVVLSSPTKKKKKKKKKSKEVGAWLPYLMCWCRLGRGQRSTQPRRSQKECCVCVCEQSKTR